MERHDDHLLSFVTLRKDELRRVGLPHHLFGELDSKSDAAATIGSPRGCALDL